MRHPRRLPSLLLVLLPLSLACGCQAWRYNPINKVKNMDSIIHYPGDGGVVISSSKYATKAVCVAPPAQGVVLQQTKGSGGVKANVADYVEVDVGVSVETLQALGQLYQQSERSLFLQYSLYRLCEAYMNNMLSPVHVKLVLEHEKTDLERASSDVQAKINECQNTLDTKKNSLEKASLETRKDELQETVGKLENECTALNAQKRNLDTQIGALSSQLAELAAGPTTTTYDQSTLYWMGFQLIMRTSVELARIDADRDKLRAEVEAAKAGEAQAKAEKAAAAAKEKGEQLDKLRKEALEADVARSTCTQCDDKACVKLCTNAGSAGN